MSDDKSAPAKTVSPGKPKSSPVGRIIIGILLVVLAIEAVPYVRMTLAHSKLSAELKKAEAEDHKITAEAVKKALGGRDPDFTRTKRVAIGDELYDVYYFNGMLKRRELCVHYGVKGENDQDGTQREMMEVTTIIPEEILIDDEPIIKPTTATPPVAAPKADALSVDPPKTDESSSEDAAAKASEKAEAEPTEK
jgi:hypothetical protein